MLGGSQRYQALCHAAEHAYASAQADQQQRETARQQAAAAARAAWSKTASEARGRADVHNAHVSEMAAGFRAHDRFAVSEYVQMVTVPEQLPNVLDRAIRVALAERAPPQET